MRSLTFVSIIILLTGCQQAKKQDHIVDTRIVLRSDTINIVKVNDTLVIPESTCRGCAYENSTSFEINDSLGIIQLAKIITTDNTPDNVAGGSISKLVVLVPVKTGTTTFKLYKFWSEVKTGTDSANASTYTVTVKN